MRKKLLEKNYKALTSGRGQSNLSERQGALVHWSIPVGQSGQFGRPAGIRKAGNSLNVNQITGEMGKSGEKLQEGVMC